MVVMSFNFVRTSAVFRCTSLGRKIRIAISLEEIDLSGTQEKLHVSVSIGFAIGATSWMELLENADRSLLRAKARGRNVVEDKKPENKFRLFVLLFQHRFQEAASMGNLDLGYLFRCPFGNDHTTARTTLWT